MVYSHMIHLPPITQRIIAVVELTLRTVPALTAVLLAWFCVIDGEVLVASGQSPNVVLIVADDLNCSIEPYRDETAKTPHLLRLAQRGLVFNRAYCQQAVCNPSRSSFLTGLRPETVGVDDLRKSFRKTADSGQSLVTLPQFFKKQGYFCQNIGKIFHNMGDTQDRRSWSIDEVLHQGTHAADTLHHTRPNEFRAPSVTKSPVSESFNVPDEYYRDGQIANLAASMLKERPSSGQPFFLAVGFWRPHLPFVAPKKYWQRYTASEMLLPFGISQYRGIPSIALHESRELRSYGNLRQQGKLSPSQIQHLRHGYYASISFLDAQVGKILDVIENSHHANNTIVIFLSDHGFHLGERGLWGKTTNFELDARVPLIISDPGSPASHGRTTNSLCELVDLYPTLVHRCGFGQEMPAQLQGKDLSPLLEDPTVVMKTKAFTQHQHPFYAPREKWEAIGFSVRTDEWRYTEWVSIASNKIVARELYHHANDLNEFVNVVENHPEVAAIHSLELAQQFPLLKQH